MKKHEPRDLKLNKEQAARLQWAFEAILRTMVEKGVDWIAENRGDIKVIDYVQEIKTNDDEYNNDE